MKTVVGIAVIAMLLGLKAAASVGPDPEAISRIQRILDLRVLAQDDVRDRRRLMEKTEEEIGLRDSQGRLQPVDSLGVAEYARRLVGLGGDRYEEYARQASEYKQSQDKFRVLSAQAIQTAKDVYHVSPSKSSGQIVSGPPLAKTDDDVPGFIGNQAAFAPKFVVNMPKDTAGYTDDAGNVAIGPDAFAYPGKLAFTIFHEGEHFERLLTPGLDLRNIPDEEASSRGKERSVLKSRFGLKDEDIVRFDAVLKSEKARAVKWRALLAQGLDPYKISHQAAFPGNYRPQWLEEGEIDAVNDLLSRAKSLREREQDARLSRIIADLAERSCDAPGSVSQAELSALPRPHDADFMDRNPVPLDPRPCVTKAYRYLGRGGVNAADLANLSEPPATPIELVPPPPLPQIESPAPLANVLPRLKKVSVAACASPENAWIDPVIFSQLDCSNRKYDDTIVSDLKSGMNDCQRSLFQGLIDAIRAGRADSIGRNWIRRLVAASNSSPVISPGSSSGSRDEHPGRNHDEARDRVTPILPR